MTRDEISAATGRETELKFSLRAETAVPARTDDDRTRAVLAALESAGFETAGPKTHEIADEYFDTPELALDEMGHSVRIRNKDGDRWVTVKAGGRDASGVFDRRETEFPIDRARHERCVATGFAELLDELLPDLPKHGETEGRRLLARTVRVIN
ncbi:MAG: CYTH domain-containing protein, partial [Planctomycetota bacterium]